LKTQLTPVLITKSFFYQGFYTGWSQ